MSKVQPKVRIPKAYTFKQIQEEIKHLVETCLEKTENLNKELIKSKVHHDVYRHNDEDFTYLLELAQDISITIEDMSSFSVGREQLRGEENGESSKIG